MGGETNQWAPLIYDGTTSFHLAIGCGRPPALPRQVDVINTTESGPELAQSGERELNSHGQHDQPHERRDHVTR